jgi:hypothetical protein
MHTLRTGHEIHERLFLATSASGTERTESKVTRSAVNEDRTKNHPVSKADSLNEFLNKSACCPQKNYTLAWNDRY